MKRMKLLFIGVLVAIGSLVYAGNIYFSNTGSMTNFIYLDVEGSEGFNCVFHKGTTVRIEGAFTAPLIIDQLTLECYLEIQGVLLPVAIPFQPVFNLPAYIGDRVRFYLDFGIPNGLPEIQCIFHVKVKDKYSNEVAGAKFPVMIVQ